MDKASRKIICTTIDKGRKHDFRIFKESHVRIPPTVQSITDSGYQGIQKIHANCVKPIKGTKKNPLTSEDKKHNHLIGSQRVMVEHTIRKMKIFNPDFAVGYFLSKRLNLAYVFNL